MGCNIGTSRQTACECIQCGATANPTWGAVQQQVVLVVTVAGGGGDGRGAADTAAGGVVKR